MIETFNFSDSVFPEHEYPEIGQGFKAGNLVQSIVVKIKKNQSKMNCLSQFKPASSIKDEDVDT